MNVFCTNNAYCIVQSQIYLALIEIIKLFEDQNDDEGDGYQNTSDVNVCIVLGIASCTVTLNTFTSQNI